VAYASISRKNQGGKPSMAGKPSPCQSNCGLRTRFVNSLVNGRFRQRSIQSCMRSMAALEIPMFLPDDRAILCG
jgi:hypothetical protein